MCRDFWLILNSGLWITEALGVRVRDIRLADGIARSFRVIGKGNRERLVPLAQGLRPGVRLLAERQGKGRLRIREGAERQGPGPHTVNPRSYHLADYDAIITLQPTAPKIIQPLEPVPAVDGLADWAQPSLRRAVVPPPRPDWGLRL